MQPNILNKLLLINKHNFDYRPHVFNLSQSEDQELLKKLFDANPFIQVFDEIDSQLRELIKLRFPNKKLSESEYATEIEKELNGISKQEYGLWFYYPWKSTLIHTLAEKEFITVRTNRNQYKITPEEQKQLSEKTISIIGLSVGQSIALTIATERICGRIKLADFDTLELSNLNRIRSGLTQLGLNKVLLAAREISEMDPFLSIEIFTDGITEKNIEEFLLGQNRTDILVEVCDGLDVKLLSREYARKHHIPVVMDTNDKGMLDIERFDLEPERPLFHGLAGNLNHQLLGGLTNEQKIPYILQIVGAENISTRLKSSMLEVEQSISTWPQLASSVTLGGAITCDVCRRILLNQHQVSGRFYVDLDAILPNTLHLQAEIKEPIYTNPHQPLQLQNLLKKVNTISYTPADHSVSLSDKQIDELLRAAWAAPSAGNNQPWKWIAKNNLLYLFHDKYRSYSWGDYYEIGSHQSLGCGIENVSIKAYQIGLQAHVSYFPVEGDKQLIAIISFSSLKQKNLLLDTLKDGLDKRQTNRMLGNKVLLPDSFYQKFTEAVTSIEGARVKFIKEESALLEMGEIIAACDRLRLIDQRGHDEFFNEIRWDEKQAQKTGDGILVSHHEIIALKIARDWNAMKNLADWNLGNAFLNISKGVIKSASSIAIIGMPELSHRQLLQSGRAVLRAWIYANMREVTFHPMLSSVFFFNRLIHGKGAEVSEKMKNELTSLRKRYTTLIQEEPTFVETFVIKLAVTDKQAPKTYRLPIDNIIHKA
jgi:hypothetical protein